MGHPAFVSYQRVSATLGYGSRQVSGGQRSKQVKATKSASIAAIVALFVTGYVTTHAVAFAQSNSGSPTEASSFLGRWDLTLKASDHEYPSWLELRQEGGQLKAQMVGRWGNARPFPKVELSRSHITFVSPKDEEGSKHNLIFDGQLYGETV